MKKVIFALLISSLVPGLALADSVSTFMLKEKTLTITGSVARGLYDSIDINEQEMKHLDADGSVMVVITQKIGETMVCFYSESPNSAASRNYVCKVKASRDKQGNATGSFE